VIRVCLQGGSNLVAGRPVLGGRKKPPLVGEAFKFWGAYSGMGVSGVACT
jgi:hypothetical protein